MAISEFEVKRCERELEKFMARKRPPAHIRDKLDIGYKIENQSVELFEIRPRWNDPSEILHSPFAKTTFVKSKGIWKIYWQRQDLKWHAYDPVPEVKLFEEFLAAVEADEYACFFG
ncbi:MAG: DUF3024 domain-containing protein [Pseudomonadales bacterium]